MRQDQMNVLFEELERFTESLVARLIALDGEKPPKKAPKSVAAKKAAKVTNGTRAPMGRPRKELTRAEAATYLSVSTNTVDAWTKRGVIPAPHTKDGQGMKLFYFQADLEGIERPKRGAA